MADEFTPEAISFWCVAFVLVLARVSTFFLVFPLFQYGNVPRLVKVSLVMSLSLSWLVGFVTFGQWHVPSVIDGGWCSFAVTLAGEVVTGGALGYFFGLFFLPAEIAGAYVGQEMGLSMATIADPVSGTSKNILGDAFGALAMLIFLGNDIHHLVIGTLYLSFASGIGHFGLRELEVTRFTSGLCQAERWGIELAAPVAVVLFLTTVLLAVMVRNSPHLNLFSVGTMLRLAFGLVATLIFLPDMAAMTSVIFSNVGTTVQQLGY